MQENEGNFDMPLQGEDVLSGAMSSPRPSASAVRIFCCV